MVSKWRVDEGESHIVIKQPLRTEKDRLIAINDSFISACLAGGRKIVAEKDYSRITSKKKCNLYTVCFYESVVTKTRATMLFEPFYGEDLEEYVIRSTKKERFNFDKTLRLAKHMCKAVSFIHELGLTHRDITPESFVVIVKSSDSKRKSWVKLKGFGYATTVKDSLVSGAELPPKSKFSAPETAVSASPKYFQGRQVKTGRNILSPWDWLFADLWSLGESLQFLFSRGGKMKSIHPEVAEVIKLLKAQQPRKRISAIKATRKLEEI